MRPLLRSQVSRGSTWLMRFRRSRRCRCAVRADFRSTGRNQPSSLVSSGGFLDRLERRAVGLQSRDLIRLCSGLGPMILPVEVRAHQAAAVDAEGVGEPVGVAVVGHVVEEAEGVGVGERAVLAPALDVVAALDVVEAAVVAPVGAGEEAACVVELDAEGVAAAFGEDLEDVRVGVVAPDGLAEEIGGVRSGSVETSTFTLAVQVEPWRRRSSRRGPRSGSWRRRGCLPGRSRRGGRSGRRRGCRRGFCRDRRAGKAGSSPRRRRLAGQGGGGDVQAVDEGLRLVVTCRRRRCLRGW